MLEFQPITLEMRRRMEDILRAEDDRGCEYTFGNIFIWRDIYDAEAAFTDDGMLIVRFNSEAMAYLFPCGKGDRRAAVVELLADTERRGVHFRIIAASKADVDFLEEQFPGKFTSHLNRDFAEYVYASDDLINLAGKKYHGKRNHISRFIMDYPDYAFEEITPDNIGEVRQMSDRWYREFLPAEQDASLEQEVTAACNAFTHFFELGFSGGLIRAGGGIAGFAIGEPINDRTFCVHIEKASYDIPGAYTVINRDFAQHFCRNYEFINREDDVGQEGLRKAKLSYHPAVLTEKYVVGLVNDPHQD